MLKSNLLYGYGNKISEIKLGLNQRCFSGQQIPPQGINVAGKGTLAGLVGSVHELELNAQVLQSHDQNIVTFCSPKLPGT